MGYQKRQALIASSKYLDSSIDAILLELLG